MTNANKVKKLPRDWRQRWLTPEEAAAVAGISRGALYKRIDRGTGPRVSRPGGRSLRIYGENLEAWLRGEKP